MMTQFTNTGRERFKVIIFFILLLVGFGAKAQTDTEFWFAAPEVDSTHADSSIMRFASINAATVTVSIPANPNFTPIVFSMKANSAYKIDWNRMGNGTVIGTNNYKQLIENTAYDTPVNKGIHVVASDKIEAYYEVRTMPNSEVFALKGKNSLGTDFYVNFQNYWYNKYPVACNGDDTVTWNKKDSLPLTFSTPFTPNCYADYQDQVAEFSWSAFDIIATQDNTTININPTNPVVSTTSVFLNQWGMLTPTSPFHPAGTTYTITLNKGQTYSGRQVYKSPTKSLGGTHISSNNPIALTCKEDGLIGWNSDNTAVWLNPTDAAQSNVSDGTAGYSLAGYNNYGIDLIGDQMIPTNLIGNQYVVMRGGLYPDDDGKVNTPSSSTVGNTNTEWDWDGERVFITAIANNTTITVKSYSNTNAPLNTTISPTLNAGQVWSYTFKYNATKANIEQFLSVTSNGPNFYTYHVSGQYSELGSAIIPTVMGCTGSTQLAFTRSYNGLFQVNLMVKQGAEGNFKVYTAGGTDVTATFGITAANFVTIPGTGWSVYTQPNNNWTSKAIQDTTYIIKNSLNVFHLGIINISQAPFIDTSRVPQYIGWNGNPKGLITFRGYPFGGTVPTSVIQQVWEKPGWTKAVVGTQAINTDGDGVVSGHIYYSLTNATNDTVIYLAHWASNNRGAFYGYFSDFNKFQPFASVPDVNHPKCVGDTIKLTAAGGVSYTWSQQSKKNLTFLDSLTAQNPRAIPTSSGMDTLTVKINGFCSKDTTYVFPFKIYATPVPTITGPQTLCAGAGNQTYTVSVADTLGFGTATKTWTITGGTIVSGAGTKSVVVNWTSSGTLTVTVDNGSCKQGTVSIPLTISPPPTVTVPANDTVCAGATVLITTLTSSPTGATYTWANTNTAIGLAASGTGQVPAFTATNTTSAPISGIVTVTPTVGCVGTPKSYTITVNPTPTVTVSPSTTVCSGSAVAASNFTSTATGSTFAWINTNTAIGLAASGTGQTPAFTATNGGLAPISGTITVTPSANGCNGTAKTYTVTVNPTPTVTVSPSATVCSGSAVAASNFTSTATGSTFAWTNTNTAIGLAASGTGQTPAFTATDASSTPITGTITVTPTAGGCAGIASSYTITVNPTPTVTVSPSTTVCSGSAVAASNFTSTATGSTFAWTNTNTAIGLAASGTGQTPAFTATNGGLAPISGTITVTPSANGCSGTAKTYTVTVNPTPTVTVSPSATVCAGSAVAASTFTSTATGSTFAWTNTNTAIGLAASGTGQTPAFTATDASSTPITGTITVTPTAGGCAGIASSYTITVNPTPTVTVPANITACNNTVISGTNFTSPVSGTTYSWTNSNTSIGLGSLGSGNIPSFIVTNPGTTTVTATITVTPSANGCTGTANTYTIIVNPTPTTTVPAATTVCNNATVATTNFVSTPAGGTFAWTNSNIAIGLAASGTGQIPAFTAKNTTTAAITATIAVTPTALGCTGTVNTYVITVNPTPTVTVPGNDTVCNGTTVAGTAFVTIPTGGTFAWTNSNTAVGLAASGTGQIAAFTGTNTGTAQISGTISVTPTVAGCTGLSSSYVVTVNPTPKVTVPTAPTVCTGATVAAFTPTSTTTGATFAWTNNTTSIGLAASGTGQVPAFTATNTGTASVTATITVTPTANGCTGTASTYTITVNPKDNAAFSYTPSTFCQTGTNPTPTITGLAGGTFSSTVGLSINTTTGLITLSTSTLGTYVVTYTTNGVCPNSSTTNVTITNAPSAAFAYAGPYCQDGSTISPTFTGSAGVFTFNPAGLSINPASGQINVNASTPGTYTVTNTIAAAGGCAAASANTTVTIKPTPTVTVPASPTVCTGTTISASNFTSNPTGATFAWTNTNASIGIGASGSGQIPSFTATDATNATIAGTISVTPTLNGCLGASGTYTITVNPTPTVTVPGNVTVCNGSTVTTTNFTSVPTGGTFAWTNNTTSIGLGANGNGQIPAFTAVNTGTAPVTATISVIPTVNTCAGVAKTYTITVNPTPTVAVPANISVCAGTTVTATSVTSGTTGATFAWTNTNSGIGLGTSGTGQVPSFIATNAGASPITGTISFTPTANTCAGTANSYTITVNPLPVANDFNGKVCELVAKTFDAHPTGGTSPYTSTFTVTFGSPTYTVSGSTITLNTAGAGVATFLYKVVDKNGCSDTSVINININQPPTLTPPANADACQNSTLTLTPKVTGANNPTYVWSDSNAVKIIPTAQLSSTSVNIITTASGNFTVCVTATDTVGCSAVICIPVEIDPIPTAKVSPANPVCQNASIQLNGQTDPNGQTYTWSGDVASLSSTSTPTPIFTSSISGTHNFTYMVTTDHGCTASTPFQVTVNPNPTVNLGPNVSSCAGVSKTLTATVTPSGGTYNYNWADDTGTLSYSGATPTYVQSNVGTHTVYITVTDASTNCLTKNTMLVTIYANPVVTPIIGEVCLNQPLQLNGNPTGGTTPYASHLWGGTDKANLSSLTIVNPIFKSATSGNNYLTYTVTDKNGCVGQNNATISVDNLPQPQITASKTEVCATANLPLTVTNVTGATSYVWTGTGATYLTPNNTATPVFNSSQAGTYTLTVTVTDGKTCVGSNAVSIVVDSLPKPVVTNDSLCAGATIQLQGDTKFAVNKWTGDVGPIPVAERTSVNPTFSTTVAKTYNLMYSVTDTKNCTDSVPVTVKVNPLPAANAGPDRNISYGDTLHLTGSPSSGQYTYSWTPKDSLISNTVSNPITVKLHSSFTFTLSVTDNKTLCEATSIMHVIETGVPLQITIKPIPAVICIGDTAFIESSVAGGKAPYSYAWSPAYDKIYTNTGSVRVKPTVSTNYSVTVTDANNNTAMGTTTVTVNQLPTIYLQNLAVCAKDTISINPVVKTQGNIGYSSLWTGGGTGGLHGVTNQAVVNFFYTQANGTSKLFLNVTDNNGCKRVDSMTVTVDTLPVVNIAGSAATVCAGTPVNLSVNQTVGDPIVSYKWTDVPPGHLSASTASTTIFTSNASGKVTLSVIDVNGCKDTTNYSITVNPNPISELPPDTFVCQNSVLALDGKPSGGMLPYKSQWTNTALLNPTNTQVTNFNTSLATPGVSYTLNYKVTDNNNCSGSASVKVTVNGLPSAIIPQPLSVCQGSPLIITATPNPSGLTGTWIDPGVSFEMNQNAITFKLDSVGVKKLYYNLISVQGCSWTDTISVTLKPNPTVTITPDNAQVCQSNTDNLKAIYAGGTNTPQSFTWSTNPSSPVVLSSLNIQNPVFMSKITGDIAIQLVYVDQNTCSNTANTNIQVNPNPPVTITSHSFHACAGQNLQLNADPTNLGVNGNPQYSWIGGNGLTHLSNTNISNPIFNATATGTYSLIYQITDTKYSCITVDTISVNVTKTPDKLDIKDTVCQNSSLPLDVSAMNATSYTWIGVDSTRLSSPFISNPKFDTYTPGVSTFQVIGTIGTGNDACSNTSNVLVDVIANPTIQNMPVSDSAVYNSQYQFTPTVTPAQVTYIWTPAVTFVNPTTIEDALTQKLTTNVNVTLSVTETQSGKNCSITKSATILVGKPMTPHQTDTTICKGDTVLLDGTTTGGGSHKTYKWIVNGKIIMDSTLSYVPTKTGTDTLIVSDGHTTDTVIKHVVVNNPPTPADTTVTACAGSIISIHGSTDATTWIWSGSVDHLTKTTTERTTFVSTNKDGTQTDISYVTSTNAFGCSTTSIDTIKIVALPTVTLPDTVVLYPGQSYTYPNTDTSSNIYDWTPPSIFNNSHSKTPTFVNLTKDTTNIQLTVTNGNGCKKTIPLVVIHPPLPNPVWPNYLCQGVTYTFKTPLGIPLKWVIVIGSDTLANYVLGSSQTITFDSLKTGTGTIAIYNIDSAKTLLFKQNIQIFRLPDDDFTYTPNKDIYIGDKVSFTNKNEHIIGLTNHETYFWDFVGSQVFTSEKPEPIYEYQDTGTYVVYLIGLDTITGCRDTVHKPLQVLTNPNCGLKYPNVFTPDLSKDNKFSAGYMVGIQDNGYDLQLYNRWGQLLWETTSKYDKWDGTFNGEVCKQDVYVYHSKALCENGKVIYINGNVTIIK